MKHNDKPTPRAQPGARSSQHISSIAHLFFDNKGEADQPGHEVADVHLMVVGSGLDTSAPYTAAGVGQHLLDLSGTVGERGTTGESVPTRQVFFAEPSAVCFSGISQLPQGSFRPPGEDESVPWPVRPDKEPAVLRLFPSQVPSEDFSGGIIDGRYFIRHLDLPRPLDLDALEIQIAAGHTTGLGNDGADGLVWCVQSSAAVNLIFLNRLGRLLRIVKPRKLYLLLYPDRSGGQGAGPGESTQALLDRACHLLKYVAAGTRVQGILMGETPEERSVQLSSLSRQLSL